MSEAMIDQYLRRVLEIGGSDLHLGTGAPARIRVHGDLRPIDDRVVSPDELKRMLHEICPAERWESYLTLHDLDFSYEIPEVARFRVNCFFDYHGMGAVLRLIPDRVHTLEELGVPEVLTELCTLQSGLVLVTGPTGSGKSTTLAAMIDYINENFTKDIIIIGDPVEFMHRNKRSVILHREVGQHCRSFPQALRGAMRSDPDIVVIGELRDLETITLGLSCAAMGMLVFATMPTNNAPKTVARIIDAFPTSEQSLIRTLLAESLRGIVSQQLCHRKGGGRVAVCEVLLWADGLPNTIREEQIANIRTIIEGNRARGMITMDSSLLARLQADEITVEEAYMKAGDKKLFLPLMEKAGLLPHGA